MKMTSSTDRFLHGGHISSTFAVFDAVEVIVGKVHNNKGKAADFQTLDIRILKKDGSSVSVSVFGE